MADVIISKTKYTQLLEKALRYDYLRQMMKENIFAPPPIKNVKKIINAFKGTNIYNDKFLKSLERGLKRSLYFHAK